MKRNLALRALATAAATALLAISEITLENVCLYDLTFVSGWVYD